MPQPASFLLGCSWEGVWNLTLQHVPYQPDQAEVLRMASERLYFFNFFFLGCTVLYDVASFPNQGSNPCLLQWKHGLNHWTAREVVLVLCLDSLVVSDSLWPYGLEPTRLLCSWNSPGKNIGMGCHALLQGIFLMQGSNPCLLWFLHSGRFFTIEPLTTYMLSESHILFIIFIKFEEIDTIHFFPYKKTDK